MEASGEPGKVMTVASDKIRRKKGSYSREKSKLFLKQYVEQNSQGIWSIKKSSLEEHGILRMQYDQIFDGPNPDFDASKKLLKTNGVKKPRQETLAKFLKQQAAAAKDAPDTPTKNNLLEQMRKREEEYKQMKLKRAEEKMAEKQKLKEENLKISIILKNWNKPKEDLELEDQMVSYFLICKFTVVVITAFLDVTSLYTS